MYVHVPLWRCLWSLEFYESLQKWVDRRPCSWITMRWVLIGFRIKLNSYCQKFAFHVSYACNNSKYRIFVVKLSNLWRQMWKLVEKIFQFEELSKKSKCKLCYFGHELWVGLKLMFGCNKSLYDWTTVVSWFRNVWHLAWLRIKRLDECSGIRLINKMVLRYHNLSLFRP